MIPMAALRAQKAGSGRTCVVNAALKGMGYARVVRLMGAGLVQCELEAGRTVVPAFTLQAGSFPSIATGQKCFVLETNLGIYYAIGVPAGSPLSIFRGSVSSVQSGGCELQYKDGGGAFQPETASIALDTVGVFSPPQAGGHYLILTTATGRMGYL
jgi:hypothetical protein